MVGRGKRIKVLVIDDSALFRQVILKGLSNDESIEVVATARDAYDAKDKILQMKPDVVTCDVEMPKMNGIEFVKQLLPHYKVPVIMVSSLNNIVFEAIRAGAVDFVAKPDVSSKDSLNTFLIELADKVKAASMSKVRVGASRDYSTATRNSGVSPRMTANISSASANKVIAIGASTGGTESIARMLKELPSNCPGIVIVQHIPPKFSEMFADRLDKTTNLKVKEAKTGDFIEPGCVLVAPGDKHMRVVKVGNQYKVECFVGERVSGHCPSVDVLFESMAKSVGSNGIGIILTGMGADGAKGLLAMKKKGAMTIGQDEESSVVYGMPKEAYKIGAVEKQLSLMKIPSYLLTKLR